MKILFAVAECLPFIKTGGLADVAGALPAELAKAGHEVRILMPGYDRIDKSGFRASSSPFTVNHMGRDIGMSLMESGRIPGVKTVLVCCDSLFHRGVLYGEPDDRHRFTVFCKAVMAYMVNHDWYADIVHCHDWHTALLPVYIRTAADYDPVWKKVRSIFTIHNLGYQGVFPPETVRDAGLDMGLFNSDALEYYGQANLMNGAIAFADKITTVSPTYAREILTPSFGEGLDGILRKRQGDLTGILNGLDYRLWDPAQDMALPARFSRYRQEGKAVCKRELLAGLGIDAAPDAPVLGIVSRLCRQKGFDALMYGMRDLLSYSDAIFIAQGTGDREYEDMMTALAADFPRSVRHIARYSEAMARRVYAGSDMFLMPSRYEPCGLGQMIALRYGALPFVHRTGGLSDTVTDADSSAAAPNGFVFDSLDPGVVKEQLWRAYLKYKREPEKWAALRSAALECRFGWDKSVAEYERVYRSCFEEPTQ